MDKTALKVKILFYLILCFISVHLCNQVIFLQNVKLLYKCFKGFPVAQMVEHGASNAKIMGSIPRESKSW